jgi:phosphatidylglycerol---prolipoprotein diacylglyceryl transferase
MNDRYWVHDWSPYLVRFTETIGIRYYGLAYVLAFALGAGVLVLAARRGRSPLGAAQVGDLMTFLILGVLLGGRLGFFLLYQWEAIPADPLLLVRIWEGGMSFHGGVLGVLAALIWFSRSRRIPFLHLGDLVCAITPIGLLLGRIANFINGELWGRTTDVAWAVIFPQSDRPGTPLTMIQPRHPSQLYEAATEGLLLLLYLQYRFWRTPVARDHPGRLSAEFFIGYSLARIGCEFFREPDAGLILGMTRGTAYSVVLLAAGVALFVRSRGRG